MVNSEHLDCLMGMPFEEIEKIINASDMDLEEMIDCVHATLMSSFVPGDKVQLKNKCEGCGRDGEVISQTRCTLKLKNSSPYKNGASSSPSPSKINLPTYDIKIDSGIIYSVPAKDLIRRSPLPKKDDIRVFLEANPKFSSKRLNLDKHKIEMAADAGGSPLTPKKRVNIQGCATKRKLLSNLETCQVSPSKKVKSESDADRETSEPLVESPVVVKLEKTDEVVAKQSKVSSLLASAKNLQHSPEKEPALKKKLQLSLLETSVKLKTTFRKKLAPAQRKSNGEMASSRATVEQKSPLVTREQPENLSQIHSDQMDPTSDRKPDIKSETRQPFPPKKKKKIEINGTTIPKSVASAAKTLRDRCLLQVPEVLLTRIDAPKCSIRVPKKLKQPTLLELLLTRPAQSGGGGTTVGTASTNPTELPKINNIPLPGTNNNNNIPLPGTNNNIQLPIVNNSTLPSVFNGGNSSLAPSKDEKAPARKKRNLITPRWAMLHGTPLPVPEEICLPNRPFQASIVGDCFLISEFIGAHADLLRPGTNSNYFPPTAKQLLQALAIGQHGFDVINDVLACLLRVIIKEPHWTKKIKVLKTNISTLNVTEYLASELARLVLKKAPPLERDAVADAVAAIETRDVCELDAAHKTCVLVAMCHLVLDTQASLDYVTKKIQVARDARQQIGAIALKEEIEKLDKENLEDNGSTICATELELALPAKEFYGSSRDGGDETLPKSEMNISRHKKREEAIKATKEKQIRDKLLEAKRIEEEKQEKQLKKLKKFIRMGRSLIRIDPLGVDRNGSRYWMLEHSGYGLIVERTLTMFEDRTNETGSTNSEQIFVTKWCHFDADDQIQLLKSALCTYFTPEKKLAVQLEKEPVLGECTRLNSINVEPNDGLSDSVEKLREDMMNLEENLYNASLALVQERVEWQTKLKKAAGPEEFAELLTRLYSAIPLHVISESTWTEKSAEATRTASKCDEADDDEEELEDMFTIELQRAATISRLHLDFEILSSCIDWDREVKLSKCQTCHTAKKKFFVTCYFCRTMFHVDCLSPPLTKLPRSSLWVCSSCETTENASQLSSVTHKPTCCNSRLRTRFYDDDVITCSACRKVYHKKCHQPPLRNTPRGDWNCSTCDQQKKRGTNVYK